MPIANYTTGVKTEKTVGEIQVMLAQAGAAAVMFEFNEGDVTAISFKLMHNDVPLSFRLPANIDKLYIVLQNDADIQPRYCTREQAARVAWRIIKDWLRAQLAIVETEQAQMVEVFLPYAQSSSGETLFERLEAGDFKMLAAPE